jgi:HAD superfamily hydrolase (TIGR01509 family)
VLAIVYGRSWRQVYADIVSRFPSLGVTIEVMEAELSVDMQRLQEARGEDLIIQGSVALLRRLAERMPVCIVSGSPCADIERAVRRMGIGEQLAFFIGAEQYGPGKPDPTCFLMARERLGVAAADCVVFEDSAAGVRAAKAAGMYCVALARPGLPAQDVSSADRVVADLSAVDPVALV